MGQNRNVTQRGKQDHSETKKDGHQNQTTGDQQNQTQMAAPATSYEVILTYVQS
jgi:hypothetical protein